MGQAIKKKTILGNDDERDIMLIGKIYKVSRLWKKRSESCSLKSPCLLPTWQRSLLPTPFFTNQT